MPRLSPPRRGVATTELAVCLPVMLLIIAGLIELMTVVFLKQSLTIAAYEGAHQGVKPAATSAEAIAAAQAIVNQRGIQGASVRLSPSNLQSVPVGQFFTVTVTAPAGPNSIAIFAPFATGRCVGTASAMKETGD